MIFNQYLAIIRNDIVVLFTQNADFFQLLGLNLFRAFATILIVWAGIKSALSAASGGPGFDFGKFADFLLALTFGYAMVRYYATPIPGLGVSFYHLITDQAFTLADRIGGQAQQDLAMKLEDLMLAIPVWKLVMTGGYIALLAILLVILLAGIELVVFAIISFGYIAIGVLALIGPVFIPFFIVPKLDFLFWGWLKSFFQYAFYPVIANAFIFIIAKLVLELLTLNPILATSFTDAAYAMAKLPMLEIVLGAGIYGILKIPVLVNHIFSGSSGEGGGGMIQTAASMAIRSVL